MSTQNGQPNPVVSLQGWSHKSMTSLALHYAEIYDKIKANVNAFVLHNIINQLLITILTCFNTIK